VSVASDHVAFFRTQRTDRYIDTVTITDLTSRGSWNRTTKQYGTPSTTTVYTGGALIRPAGAAVSGATGAGAVGRGKQAEVLFDFFVYLPVTATGVQVGNVVTVDATLLASDLVGVTMSVQSIENDSYETRRTLECKLSQGGGDLG
jgi:hypothetical protein